VDGLRFEWDSRKNQANIQRHGIPFEEAQTAFMDDKGGQSPQEGSPRLLIDNYNVSIM